MNETFKNEGRKILKNLLSKCTEKQQNLFKRMYSGYGREKSEEFKMNLDINNVVDNMDAEKIDFAITQVENTINKQK